MNFYHYSINKIPKIIKRDYRAKLWCTHIQNKPQGFWIAIENPEERDCDSWFDICDNDTMRDRVKHKYRIILDPNAKYLFIRNSKELDEFSDAYGYWKVYVSHHPIQQMRDAHKVINDSFKELQSMADYIDEYKLCDRLIDWNWVMGKYQGIIINPYIYEKRYKYKWYSGWDCASGCIWDTTTIKGIEYVKG